MPNIKNTGAKISNLLGDIRQYEYAISYNFLKPCSRILDVGCGSGTFLRKAPDRIEGLDYNPENVEFCQTQGLKAQTGDARQLPFADNSFDGVHFSHVLQVFHSNDAVAALRELARVTRPGGLVVVTTLNWFERFYRHPENARAYPPDALRRLFATLNGASSPMFARMPALIQKRIWLRRPPLIEFYSATNHTLDQVSGVLNKLQYRLGLRKYWAFDAYVVCFEKQRSSAS
jgi:SAM-dependent methyltransferase